MPIRASRLLVASLGLAFLSTAALAADTAAPPPLIERVKLFGNPERTAAQISPDGKWLSWLAPRDGVLNVWVAPTSDPAQAKPLTAEKVRPIRGAFWSPDSAMVLYVNDTGATRISSSTASMSKPARCAPSPISRRRGCRSSGSAITSRIAF